MGRYQTQVKEVVNRNAVVGLALDQEFNVYLPVYDGGVDFILHRERDGETRKVQLKSRWTVSKKYIGHNIWVAFPIKDVWHLMPHDEMLRQAEAAGYIQAPCWDQGGVYSLPAPSKAIAAACAAYRFEAVAVVATEIPAEDAV